jgi:VIT1/CCC1 family predicted Fe2+/Mn2+ transporter
MAQVPARKQVLDPIDRLTEVMFGLLMVLTFTGTMSVTLGQGATVREILLAAIGCNLAWGIVDGLVYVLASITERRRARARRAGLRTAAGAVAAGRLRDMLPEEIAEGLASAEIDQLLAIARRHDPMPPGPTLLWNDLRAAFAVFCMVVLATWPPILPFLLTDQVHLAMRSSNIIAVAMLVAIGWQLDRVIGDGSRLMRWVVPVLGAVMVAVTIALGG